MSNQLNVLVADDYPAIINGVIVEFKTEQNLKVVAVTQNVNEIEAKIIQYKIDILITDCWFRSVSYETFIKNLRLKYPLLKIIIYTQEERFFFVKDILPSINGYVLKIEPEGVLMKAIQRVLQNKKAISEDIRDSIDTDIYFNNSLSKQENKILSYRISGISNKLISDQISISEKTVRKHIDNARKKLGFHRTEEMMRWFWKGNK
ncbi:LuxR C-terminal-related transcriptional regulator [Emticicia agri]|uniref:Response regulator transcription factor n=1 Tax=Emticicia agri TaxID=2492393 RepID=A0A4Q5LXG6_9BACT|nr:response regulator transcription factor [Emticicia agri]RYU94444.1 response regulator transcription factor [Emticicia agri]